MYEELTLAYFKNLETSKEEYVLRGGEPGRGRYRELRCPFEGYMEIRELLEGDRTF